MHVTFSLTQSVCTPSPMSVYFSVFLTELCVCISHGAVCYEVIVSCRGSSTAKVIQVGSCQMVCPPLTGPKGSRAACHSPWGNEEEGGFEVDMCHAVLAPPLAATPAILGRLLPLRVSLIVPCHDP